MQPQTRYAKSGDIYIAYQVFGDGPLNVVFAPPAFTKLVRATTRGIAGVGEAAYYLAALLTYVQPTCASGFCDSVSEAGAGCAGN
jgi:hypothetical protein